MRILLILSAFGLMAMLTVWQHSQSVKTGYEIVRLRSERDLIAEENRRLELEADRLKSPENLLDWIAKHRPDLRPVRPEDVLRVKGNVQSD